MEQCNSALKEDILQQQSGFGTDGKEYKSPSELWQASKGEDGSYSSWYERAVEYWDAQEASINGVLGGYGHMSDIDIRDSTQLIKKAFRGHLEAGNQKLTALDCGAGIGRVSELLLLHYFHVVDLVEPSQHLLEQAKKSLLRGCQSGRIPKGHSAGEFYHQGMETFHPQPQRYDCIWAQWCLLYLTDGDLVLFLQRCKQGLKENGLVVVKENVCQDGFVLDAQDSSVCRSNQYYLTLFQQAEMKVVYNIKQRNFPKALFDVRQYVLKPIQ